VRAELHRILASDIFTRSERLSAYLTFIVERTLAGEGNTLKEQVIATELYGKASDFSTAGDPIVRVDARRLRDRLREYYDSSPPGSLVISVPKGTYTPEFTATEATATPHEQRAAPAATPRRSPRWWVAAAAPAAIVIAAWLVGSLLTRHGAEPTKLLTVTSLPGAEDDPSLSPDGKLVAFSWAGPTVAASSHIWVKEVDTDAQHQLTATPGASDSFPAWSPNGQIAFTREVKGRRSVWMVSAGGGPEKMIEERSSWESWLPDGKSMVLVSHSQGRDSLVLRVLESDERKQLAEAPVGFSVDHPTVSPDGKAVAFVRTGEGRAAVFLEMLSGGEPTQLVDWISGVIGGLVWTPDGRDIMYGNPETSGRRLVRLTVGSRQPATPVAGVPFGSLPGSTSRPRAGDPYRLAIASGQPDISLQLVDLHAPPSGATITAATPFDHSTRMDVPGRFSRDASLVAFVSDRNGSQQVWVARRDQSELRSITRLQDATVNIGSWSPDGRSIAFDATIAGNTGIYVASVDGGSLTRLTKGQATEMDPEWSMYGPWIYYASNETGRSEIWKMSPDGRNRSQLTSEGGFEPRESSDGQYVYFVTDRRGYSLAPETRLERIPTQGGAASLVYSAVVPGAWSVAGDSVVFLVARPNSFRNAELDVVATYDLVHQRVRELGALPFRIAPVFVNRFLTVSRDGRWALAPHFERWERDIFVLDNYR
jgi:Tol biopolymer transport system component